MVPRQLDPTYGTVREDDMGATGQAITLVGSPGDCFLWNQAVLHYGGHCQPEATPRISIAAEFQRRDAPAFARPLLWPWADLDFSQRLDLVAQQILQYDHMAPPEPR